MTGPALLFPPFRACACLNSLSPACTCLTHCRHRAAAEFTTNYPTYNPNVFKGVSYSEQYDALYDAGPLNTKQVSLCLYP